MFIHEYQTRLDLCTLVLPGQRGRDGCGGVLPVPGGIGPRVQRHHHTAPHRAACAAAQAQLRAAVRQPPHRCVTFVAPLAASS
eukprot:10162-Eustigmatos_ZCMA.PRE.1